MAERGIKLIQTAFTAEQFPRPTGLEIILAGRSNVGKSTLINQLGGRKEKLTSKQGARVSQTPGCTQSINFYTWDSDLVLVDFPGFGYAKLPHAKRKSIELLMESYFSAGRPVAVMVHLADIRLPVQKLDWQMIEWGKQFHYPYLFTLNKCDKLSRSQIIARTNEMRQMLGKVIENHQILPVSAKSGEGIQALKRMIREMAVAAHSDAG